MGQISFLFLTLLVSSSLAASCNNLNIDEEWDSGLTADLDITPDYDASSFTLVLTFDQELTSFQQWSGVASSTDQKTWTIENYEYSTLTAGETFSLRMLLGFSTSANLVAATLDGNDVCECEDGWSRYSTTGNCYQYFSSEETWEDAQSYCQNLGAELASVTTEGENDFLTTLTQERAFVGGYKDDTDTWQWSDGSTWDYTNWSTGQPDDAQGMQGYVVINYEVEGPWDDEWYTATYPFICEK